MSFAEIFVGFLVALAAGALIGIEREQSMVADRRTRIGGIRTFPLIALAGALSALLSHTVGVWTILGALLVVGAFLSLSYSQKGDDARVHGVTTEVSALITFLLGALALVPGLPAETGQRYLLIIASAAVVMALLSFKEPLHQAVAKVTVDDIYATAKFVIMVLVVLPLLPNRTFGPLDVLNPFHIGLMVVLIAAVSFLGYIATRAAGERTSLVLSGLLGGLVSSTAVTVSLSGAARRLPSTSTLAAAAIVVASGTMFARILAVIGIVDPALLATLWWPVGLMMAVSYIAGLGMYLQSNGSETTAGTVVHRNPFGLRPALQFGLLYALVILASRGAARLLGDPGLYLTSVLAGLTDVDAITLSMARFHADGLAAHTAATAITLAAATNTASKAAIAAWFGGGMIGWRVAAGLGAVLAAGIVALAFAGG